MKKGQCPESMKERAIPAGPLPVGHKINSNTVDH